MQRALACLIGAVTLGGLAAQAAGQQTPAAGAAQIAAGRKIYDREKCATCHQIARQGNSRFPLDGVASRLKPDQIRRWIVDTAAMENALPRLPAVRMSATKYRLKPAELDALVAYLATLK
jgi:mono/diheme cytochrome c family protein